MTRLRKAKEGGSFGRRKQERRTSNRIYAQSITVLLLLILQLLFINAKYVTEISQNLKVAPMFQHHESNLGLWNKSRQSLKNCLLRLKLH